MSGWRGSGGRGCRPLLREIWQGKPGEKRGREPEGVAESSKGFWPGKGSAGGKAEGPVGIGAPFASRHAWSQQQGRGQTVLTEHKSPEEGLGGAGLQKEETEAASRVGRRKGIGGSLG